MFLQNYGFSRAVVPREASIDEIMNISKQSDIELEVFVHGALCMCFSGQCYLSSIIGSRSGNRGLCAQPCRLKFRNGENSNVLSLKDLNLINHVKDLTQSGVASLKIEGRMKRPEYVATASQAYKMALNGEKVDENSLKAIFSRQGFTDGYFNKKIDKNMFGTRQKDESLDTVGALKQAKQIYHKQNQSVSIKGEFSVSLSAVKNGAFRCDFKVYNKNHNVTCSEFIAQIAQMKPTSQEDCFIQLSKTGGTPFYFEEIKISLPENIFIAKGFLNNLRRTALEKFSLLMTQIDEIEVLPFKYKNLIKNAKKTNNAIYTKGLTAEFLSVSQLNQKIVDCFDYISLPTTEILKNKNEKIIKENIEKLQGILPYPFGDKNYEILSELKEINLKRISVNSFGEIDLCKNFNMEFSTRYTFNIMNSISANEIINFGADSITISFENEMKDGKILCDFIKNKNIYPKMIIYGYLPLMKFRNCPVKSFSSCSVCLNKGFSEIVDRTKRTFFIKCQKDYNNISVLYNCNPLCFFDMKNKIPQNAIKEFLFTKENIKEIENLMVCFENEEKLNVEYTRGLYFKGVK
ncbi:MAG: U32 family peptidase [Oscillospiraceae bacterium]